MPMDLNHLEGKKICVVFLKDEESPDTSTVQLRTLHGRANTSKQGQLTIEYAGGSFQVPSSALNTILPSDGTEILKDSDYFVICKVAGMEL